MSDRERGNTDAPKVDTEYGQRRHEPVHDGAGGNADGNVRARRVDRTEPRAGEGRDGHGEEKSTSWVSVVIGWLAALGAVLVLSGIVTGIVGAIFGATGRQGLAEGGTTALVGLLITLFLAFLVGGYAAGRMAARSGLKHGLLVPLVALAVLLVLAIIGGLLGVSLIDQLSSLTLPQSAQDTAQSAQRQAPTNLGTILSISGLIALLLPFVGGALGGLWGARTGSHRP